MRIAARRKHANRRSKIRNRCISPGEKLEPRIMFSGSPPSISSSGARCRRISQATCRTTGETITFTVYNQQATPISGVLLTDTLLPGVTFLDASLRRTKMGRSLPGVLAQLMGLVGRASR